MAPISGPVTHPYAGAYPAAVAAFTSTNRSVASRTICTRLDEEACSESSPPVFAASSGPAAARLLSNPKRRMHKVDLWSKVIGEVVISSPGKWVCVNIAACDGSFAHVAHTAAADLD